MSEKEKDLKAGVKKQGKDAEVELPFCVTDMGPEQARAENESEPCDDYRSGDYTKGAKDKPE